MKSRVLSKLAARGGGCTGFDEKRKLFRYRWMVSGLLGCEGGGEGGRAGTGAAERALIARELIKL